jgi:putative nucleotidyltransferase with HDIG domain
LFEITGEHGMRTRDCRELLEKWRCEGSFDLYLPEVAALRGIPQPEKYHSEGDVFTHTMLAVEAVDDDADPRVFWGVLLHDIGKAKTTNLIDGRWRAHGHAEEGSDKVRVIMERTGFPELAADVAWLVRHHTFHFSWELRKNGRLTKKQRTFIGHTLFPLLLEVCLADAEGSRGSADKGRKIRLIADVYFSGVKSEG